LNDHTTIDPEKKLVYIYVSTGGYNPVLNPPTQGTVTLFTSSDWRTGYENICEFILPDVVVQDAAILNGIVYMAASDGLYLAKIHLQWRAPERKSKVRKSSLPGVKAHIPRNDPHQGPPALSTDSDLDFIQNVLGDPLIRGRNLFVRANAGLGQFLNAGSTDRAILEIHRSNGGIRSMDGWKSDFPWYNGRNASISGRESGESWEFLIDGIFLNKSGDYEITCSLFRSGEVVGASSRTITLREPANFKVLFVPLRHNVFSESIDTHSPERTFEDIYNYLKIFPYPSSAIGQQGLDSTYWDIWPEVVTIPDICIGQENGRCTDMFQFDTCGVGNALGDIVREYNSRAAVKANLVMGLLYFSCWYPSGLCEGFGKLAYARIGEYAVVAHEIGHAMGLHRHNDQYLAGEWPCLAYGWDPFNRNYFWVDYSIMETHAAGNCLSSDELEQILQYWGPGASKKPPEVLKRIV
jgi:hypothetical protein